MALPKRPSFGNNDSEVKNLRNQQEVTPPLPQRDSWNDVSQEDPELYEEEQDDFELFAQPEAPTESFPNFGYDEGDDQREEDADEDAIEQELSALSKEVQESITLLMEEILSDESSEVIMNGPDSIHCKRNGQRIHLTDIDFGDIKTYHHIINKFILEYCDTNDRIHENAYIVEGQLEIYGDDDENESPMVARVHVVAPPAVRFAKVTIAKKARQQFTLDDISARGAMNSNMHEFVKAIARGKLTTVISGLSGSGKTTFLEAMSYYFDKDDRVVVAEDTSELSFPLPDVVYMVSSKPKPGDSDKQNPVSLDWLVQQANRMRPDRIVVGETRGPEIAEFLVAANSGADGSMTTLHAQDPERAWMKMANLASKASGNRSELSIVRDIASTVQIIIQTALIDGQHIVTHITEVSTTVSQQSGKIALNPIFEYDRRLGIWKNLGRPSEDLKSFLSARDVTVDLAWFQK